MTKKKAKKMNFFKSNKGSMHSIRYNQCVNYRLTTIYISYL